LLGWAAFVGFFVLVLSSPLNHFLSKRGVKARSMIHILFLTTHTQFPYQINKELLAARDVRMGILNELMSGELPKDVAKSADAHPLHPW
jgi:hypothetical protein